LISKDPHLYEAAEGLPCSWDPPPLSTSPLAAASSRNKQFPQREMGINKTLLPSCYLLRDQEAGAAYILMSSATRRWWHRGIRSARFVRLHAIVSGEAGSTRTEIRLRRGASTSKCGPSWTSLRRTEQESTVQIAHQQIKGMFILHISIMSSTSGLKSNLQVGRLSAPLCVS